MLTKLSEIWSRWCKEGIHFPYAHDPETGKPSETLLFYKAMTTITILSVIALQFEKVSYGTVFTTGGILLMGFIMYRLRKLDKVKIDVNDQSIELDSEDEK